jgi:group II intron reverse transcriptase/maturase
MPTLGYVPVDANNVQKKLSLRATRDPHHRFEDLYGLLYNPDWLEMARRHVSHNKGKNTPGVDGMTMTKFEANLEGNMLALRTALKAGTFRPDPVRRRILREVKAGGRIKERPLGIATITDRIVQEAVRMILEPIYEADFSRHSYGFRPNRCTMDAVGYIGLRLTKPPHYGWVIEGDIESYFDSISHKRLMEILKKRVKDKKILKLIERFLRAGVLEGQEFFQSEIGAPQGGILSPLLSNIYLDALDKYMEQYTELSDYSKSVRKKRGLGNFLYARYADDFAVLCNGSKRQAEAMKQELSDFLASELKLELSWEKTRVTHISDGFQFLGFEIDRNRTGSGKLAPRIRIPRAAAQRMTKKVYAMLKGSTTESVRTKIHALNRVIRGWCQYYQYTSSPSRMFARMECEVFWLMTHWLGKKFKLSVPKVMRRFWKANRLGTRTTHLLRASSFKAKRYRVRTRGNPYLQDELVLEREARFDLDEVWRGQEGRAGQADWREEVYLRDRGMCGWCGTYVPWRWAILDHIRPRYRFHQPDVEADRMSNLHILCQRCNGMKTTRDLQAVAV